MNPDPLKIAIVVHGRFYAFDLARELIAQGHDVTVLTNYPKLVCKKFGIPSSRVKSFLWHGILTRSADWLRLSGLEPYFHRLFSKWAAKNLVSEPWDIIKVFSGVAEEVLKATQGTGAVRILVRASAHIRLQSQLLKEEEERAGVRLKRPSEWMIAREEREYQLADYVLVLADFCARSFIDRGFLRKRLITLALGADLNKFRPPQRTVENRRKRLLANERLRVLTVGTFSFQKGALDLCEMAVSARGKYAFRFVGPVAPEADRLAKAHGRAISFHPKIDESLLREHYEWADVFVFPTIQDGYPAVLAQALASALPVLTTMNCSGPEMIRRGRMGWILPIRDARSFLERLEWCDLHRSELAEMIRNIYEEYTSLDYANAAKEFSSVCAGLKKFCGTLIASRGD